MIIVSSSPPMRILDGQPWQNSIDKRVYIACIRERMWISSAINASVEESMIVMPKGTVYVDLHSGNEYKLGSTVWKIYRLSNRLPPSPKIDRSMAFSWEEEGV